MASIKSFIQDQVLLSRLKENGLLIVYDPKQRDRDLCAGLATETRQVIDAGASSIESRDAVLATLQAMGRMDSGLEGMLVYVPAPPPLTDEEKQHDPFALYTVCGGVFPDGDGDEYMSLCLRSKPDQATAIRRIFADNPDPGFDVIDAVGGAAGWPNLQALLKVDSCARDTVRPACAAGRPEGSFEVARSLGWRGEGFAAELPRHEARDARQDVVGDWRRAVAVRAIQRIRVRPTRIVARCTDRRAAGGLEARPLVEDLCDRLRNDRRTQPTYIERAEHAEKELNLVEVCKQINDLGVRDTFPFEERSFFRQAVEALQRDDVDKVRQILGRHVRSVWTGKGECQAQWVLLQAAVSLVETCDDADRQLADHARSQETLIAFYLASLREVDRLQREFEQATGDYIDFQGDLHEVVARARSAYRGLVEKVQGIFVKHLETSGWPPTGMLSNADVFDRLVAPKLQESGRRVGYVLVDALRYELGVALEKQLLEDGQVEMQPAFAQLPTVTPVGMASLLPEAGKKLHLARKNNEIVPMLGETPLNNVTQRMDLLRERYGARFQEVLLNDFIQKRYKVADSVELLVIRTTGIDSHLESSPDTALQVIADSLKRVRVAIHKLREMEFDDAIVATDHGFFLNAHAEAGDACKKPPGNWITLHERSLLGDGTADGDQFCAADRTFGDSRRLLADCRPTGHGGLSHWHVVLPRRRVATGGGRAGDRRAPGSGCSEGTAAIRHCCPLSAARRRLRRVCRSLKYR